MILSGIYIEGHFLFEEPQIVNLGGRYNYSIEAIEKLKQMKILMMNH